MRLAHAAMRRQEERILVGVNRRRPGREENPQRITLANRIAAHRVMACCKVAPATVVVLHLRARYVSKAPILTLPIRSVSVENRSPA